MWYHLPVEFLGRSTAEDLKSPVYGNVLVTAGEMITERLIQQLEQHAIHRVKVRSPVTCQTKYGICATCYGRDLGRGHLVNRGEAVGVIAAQSIGEPGTQLTMRTFHMGGVAEREQTATGIIVKTKGTLHFDRVSYIRNTRGNLIVNTRSGEVTILDTNGIVAERYQVPYGAELFVEDGTSVLPDQSIARWDPHIHPIINEVGGIVKLENFVDSITVSQSTDDGNDEGSDRRPFFTVLDSKQKLLEDRPAIRLVDEQDQTVMFPKTNREVRYLLPTGAQVLVQHGSEVNVGDVLARIPHEYDSTRDITGGLPRVAELFEARKPKDPAVYARHSGSVSFGEETKGKIRLIITDEEGNEHKELIAKGRSFMVFDGETVERGEQIVDGAPVSSDILELKGVEELTAYIVKEVQEVYRLQGVAINDKHIEVIVRQMLRKVRIEEPGTTKFLPGELVERSYFEQVNEEIREAKELDPESEQEEANAVRVLLGITKASLMTESFISAASFQETTRVLTDASVSGKVDKLRGLKENVIVGRLIPAGTGLVHHEERKRQRRQQLSLQTPEMEFEQGFQQSVARTPDDPESVIDPDRLFQTGVN